MALDSAILYYYQASKVYAPNTTGIITSDNGADPWLPTLAASLHDWDSTVQYTEGTANLDATGWKSFTIDPTHITLTGDTAFKLKTNGENQGVPNFVAVNSQNAASNKPYLIVTETVGGIIVRTLMGVGL